MLRTFSIFLAIVSAQQAIAAPPQLDYLFPAGAGRGQAVEVTAGGTFENWPVEAWSDREGIVVEAAEKKGQLKITVADQAECGVYWLRLFDAQGASSLRPFFVGTLPEVAELEPNDAPQHPQALSASIVVNGKLEKRGDVDGFAIELQQGQTLIAAIEANETLGSPMDAVLQICSHAGFVLAQNEDARGLDPMLVFDAPSDGTFIVRTFAFPSNPNSTIALAGADNYVYRLTVTTGGFLDHTLPLALRADESAEARLFGWNLAGAASQTIAPRAVGQFATVFHAEAAGSLRLPVQSLPSVVASQQSSLAAPQPVEWPVVVSGRIESPGDADAFRIRAVKGQKISARIESRALSFPLDAVLEITDAAGKVLAEVDDTSGQRDPLLSYTAAADADYDVRVRDLHGRGGLRYAYRLTIDEPTPDVELTLAGDSFVLKPGAPLEIPVTIVRQNGFAGEIEIAATDLPSGVSAEPAISSAEGDSAKAVKLILRSAGAPASGAFRVVGRVTETPTRSARFPIKDRGATHDRVWLTVLGTAESADE